VSEQVRDWSRYAWRIAAQYSRSREELEDAASDAVYKVLKTLKDRPESHDGYLRSVCKYAVYDFFRSEKYRRFPSYEGVSKGGDPYIDFIAPYDPYLEADERIEASGILGRTEGMDRLVCAARAQGYEFSEIAALTGTTVSSLKSRAFRCGQRLRTVLE
jgi:DNA-directed RNA polymerase specialized sigma24 family protein